jgi:S-adenosylmethionine:tRNA ribosyltransferase-isomerase
MLITDFDYDLPPHLIAQHPPAQRGQSRLLVVPRGSGPVAHRQFSDLPDYLQPGDCLILNDTRVIPARLSGRRPTGGRAEVLLLRPLAEGNWEALVRPGRRLHTGQRVEVSDELTVEIIGEAAAGLRLVRLHHEGELLPLLDRVGQMPLPPYIRRPAPEPADRSRYQTVYAATPGAAAAPTAGLHFTPSLLASLADRDILVERLTLHVGLGTFRPVTTQRLADHVMHAEWYSLPPVVARRLNRRRAAGGRLIAVGTTVVRTLETLTDEQGLIHGGEGQTSLFITPGYTFRATDALLTNFHLPRSTLLVMVSAFAGRQRILSAYREAIAEQYRFFSYGDATLLL